MELPIELQSRILQHLHWSSIAAFARTSQHNYKLVRFTLSSLRISIFHRRLHGLLAAINDDCDLLSDECEDPAWKNSNLTVPPSVQRVRKIMKQNANLEQILRTPMLAELSSLTVNTYGLLSMALAKAMATNLSQLRQLTLNFSHPYIHDPVLPPRYWKTCPDIDAEGSPAWNALAGFGDQYSRSLKMTGLQKLSITRAAITSAQLSRWVGASSELCELRLDLVSGVDNNFVQRLADVQVEQRQDRRPLRLLSIQRCPGLHVRAVSDARWIQDLVHAGLQDLHLKECRHVDSKLLKNLVQGHGWGSGLPLKLVGLEQTQEDTLADPGQDNNADSSRGARLSMEGFNLGERLFGGWKFDVA
ncbi:hypothetical protein DV738_g419, partial [Chaetothyriales sp. CBS 135597]